MLLVGIFFILLGFFNIGDEIYDFKSLFSKKKLTKKDNIVMDNYFTLRLLIGLLSITVGILSIANYIIY